MGLGHGAQLLHQSVVELAQLERHGEHRPVGGLWSKPSYQMALPAPSVGKFCNRCSKKAAMRAVGAFCCPPFLHKVCRRVCALLVASINRIQNRFAHLSVLRFGVGVAALQCLRGAGGTSGVLVA